MKRLAPAALTLLLLTAGSWFYSPAPATAGALAPESRKRAWDTNFLATLQGTTQGDPIRFELVDGEFAEGTIERLEHAGNEVIYVAGKLSTPETGRFFFQKQSLPGKAGAFAGVVEFPQSEAAYRIESNAEPGSSDLVARPLNKVLCLRMPSPSAGDTNQVEEIPPLKPSDFPTVPIPIYQNGVIVLESLPGSIPVIYLDFQGGYTPTWGGITYDRPSVSNTQIKDVWVRVAEDYMPFNINVTTDLKVFQNAPGRTSPAGGDHADYQGRTRSGRGRLHRFLQLDGRHALLGVHHQRQELRGGGITRGRPHPGTRPRRSQRHANGILWWAGIREYRLGSHHGGRL